MALPTERHISANGLTHRVLEWTAAQPESRLASLAPVVLIHGWMDAAGSWDLVAPVLASAGHRVLAPDMRGYGGTERAPVGSYYHFPDYIADLAALVDVLLPRTDDASAAPKLHLIGHSMGGTIATLYTSARPERVLRLGLLEGTGPPDNDMKTGATRLTAWLDQLAAANPANETRAIAKDARLAAMRRHPPASYEMMLRRLIRSHPGVDVATLRTRLPHLVEQVDANEDAYAWRADPRHKMTSPMPFFADLYKAYAARITCPTLLVSGGTTGYAPSDGAAREAAFVDAQVHKVTLEGAGHMMHWTQPEALAAAILRHVRSE